MAWTTPSATHLTGEVITAAWANILENNFTETAPAKATAAGDIFQATGANAIARLALGAAKKVLRVNDGATAVAYGAVEPASGHFMGAVDTNYHIEQGSATPDGTGAIAVTFTNPFTTLLAICLGVRYVNEAQSTYYDTASGTGFTLHGVNTHPVSWIAIGQD